MGSGPNNTGSGPAANSTHYLDQAQVIKQVYDPANNALKVIHHDTTNYAFSLNSDSDSVLALREVNLTSTLGTAIPCVGMSMAGVHCTAGSISVQVNLQDSGGTFVTIGTITSGNYQTFSICARRIQLIDAGSGAGHLCVQG